MKSKFAKIIDTTVGGAMIFMASAAVARYYMPGALAAFTAASVTACALLIASASGRKRDGKRALSAAAADMFYDFMFEPDRAPAELLRTALAAKDLTTRVHGNALYVGRTAAFFAFAGPPDEHSQARMIARAKHYGADKVIMFCATRPPALVAVRDIKTSCVTGDNVYRLFASLSALPRRRFEKKKRPGRLSAFSGALSTDKLIKYLLLALSMLAVYLLTGNIMTAVCAALAAALFIAAAVFNIVSRKS